MACVAGADTVGRSAIRFKHARKETVAPGSMNDLLEDTISVDYEGHGASQSSLAIGVHDLIRDEAPVRPFEIASGQVRANQICRFFGKEDYGKIIRMLLLKGLQHRHFRSARPTPRCPEIDEYHLAAKGIDIHHDLIGNVPERQRRRIGRRGTQARASAEKKDHDQCHPQWPITVIPPGRFWVGRSGAHDVLRH